jgi:sigma-B regulation protein RsbU (phosphoserine phosphatase)
MHVLVSDDQPDVREALRLLLKGGGHQAETVDSPHALLEAVDARTFDLILMDLNYTRDTTSGREGMDLLAMLEARGNPSPVVVMTAWGDIELAVEAMRRGAADFVQKPWDNARLIETLERQAREHAERTAARRRDRWEREVAQNVQRRLFPVAAPSGSALECAARCCQASDVGGDYYDFLDLGGGRTGMVLADVSGKGIAAAILMAHLRASFRSQPASAFDRPAALLAGVHRLFWESTPAEQYATLVYAEYNRASRQLQYVNCGHLPPVLLRAEGGVERLPATSSVFGLLPEWTGEVAVTRFEPGDTLWLFSDGITEASTADGAEFGDSRLLELLFHLRNSELESAIDRVLSATGAFGDSRYADDRTVLAARVQG